MIVYEYEEFILIQIHPGDSFGYAFHRGGKKVVYATDSEHREESENENYPFLEFARNADLLVFDAQYRLMDHIWYKQSWGHSSNIVGVELAVRSGVKRLCLYPILAAHIVCDSLRDLPIGLKPLRRFIFS
jgi:ribonuclease BN (tRNA processing enzyme)